MPQLYYDSNNQIRAPQDSDYSIDSVDYCYNRYIDTLYYFGFCKNHQIPTQVDTKRQILHSKNLLLMKLTELEVSVGYSASDHLVEMFDENQVTGWMKQFERKVEGGQIFLYPKE